ncbi:MAG: periplasmic folding chaperone [Sodalis sp. Fle]|nr:MAG: periplasmic folding chaperone [Sodalis sp. Fle]
MMNNLQAAAKHIVFKIIFGLVVVSFVLTGIGNYMMGDSGDYAVKVNGQQISRAQLEQAVQNERHRQQESMGEQFFQLADNESYMHEICQQVLSQLIDEVLLDQYANTLGLVIGDDQIKQTIFAIPAFRTENKFDNNKFRAFIGNMGLTLDQYVLLMRKKMRSQQLIKGIVGSSFLLPAEIDHLLAVAIQIREARLAIFDISWLATKQTASDDEIQENYDSHKNKYISPEMFKVSYILIDSAAMKAKITVDEQEIQAWYDQHSDQFIVPARKHYSIIQSRTKTEAQALLQYLQQGNDFAALAKSKSSDVISAKNGGDIGWISDINTIEELKQANLSYNGQLSRVIQSSVGFLIIRLDDIQPARVKALNSVVRDDIMAKVKQEKTMDAFYALQQKVSDAASNDNKTLVSVETVAGVKAKQTDWFSRDEMTAELNFYAVKQVLFDGSLLGSNGMPGRNSDVISIDGNRAFIIRVTDHKPERVKQLTEVHEQVEQEVKRQKAHDQARIEAQKALIVLKQGKDDRALKPAGLNFSALQRFNSTNQDDPLVRVIFSLPPPQDKASYGIASNGQGNIVVVALEKIKPRPLDIQQRTIFINQLRQTMTRIIFDVLLDNLRSEAKIKMGTAVQAQ